MSKRILTSSMEDYLETIFNLERTRKVARVKDIAQRMKVKMSSVSGVVKTLAQRKLIKHEKHGYVELTLAGTKVARMIHKRHQDLTRFLVRVLGMTPQRAEDDACGIEHAMSRSAMRRLRNFMSGRRLRKRKSK